MSLVFLVANQAWVFVLGTTLVRLEDKSGKHPMFFRFRAEACEAARLCGLTVTREGAVR